MPASTPVRDVMTKQVVTLTPDQTFEAAADLLAERGIGAAPVVDGDRLSDMFHPASASLPQEKVFTGIFDEPRYRVWREVDL